MTKAGDDREARLAAALRANLKRRKAQARAAPDANGTADDEPGRKQVPSSGDSRRDGR